MAHTAPGKSSREGISIIELGEMFPTEESAREWFEERMWPDGRYCPHCGSTRTHEAGHNDMPYRCSDCRGYFSIKTGTVMHKSPMPLRKWVFAVYLHLTSLKGISSMKLHRDIGTSQKSAWFMLQRIRKAWESNDPLSAGPLEVDETYIGGRERNKHESKKLKAGRGTVGKSTVIGAKDRKTKRVRAKVIKGTDAKTLQGFVLASALTGATVYTDDHKGYHGLPFEHEAVKHSISEYVRDEAHTNGIESFWSLLKRGYHGTYHKMSPKHLQRYVNEFAGRANVREFGTADQMSWLTRGMAGKRLMYRDLITDNGLSSGARS